jgi:hypothetical protein
MDQSIPGKSEAGVGWVSTLMIVGQHVVNNLLIPKIAFYDFRIYTVNGHNFRFCTLTPALSQM